MECKLCEQEYKALEKSHIIPEWMYKPIYSDKHKFIEINSQNFKKLEFEQKGYRERLLCKACEGVFSKWEVNAKNDLEDITNQDSKFLKVIKFSNQFIYVENINHDYFKKFILSILWRMSVSSLSQFENVKLGIHEEIIRKLLHENSALDTLTYPIMLHQIQVSGKHYKDLIMCVEKGRLQNKYIFQSFVAYGYMFDVVISKNMFPCSIPTLLLNVAGTVPIKIIDIMSLPHDKNLLQRFNDVDVLSFHNKI